MLQRLPLQTTRFVAVSKSGGTGETLMQTIAVLDTLKRAGRDPHDHLLGITEPAKAGKPNGLRELLSADRIQMMDHDPGVGGRYSVLSNVGLLPAAVCGLDIGAIRAGAADALAPVLAGKAPAEVPAAVGAALAATLAPSKPLAVMMAYADRLERFTRWYVQLWAESLGKDGKGTTPLAALGPVDQHSQLQLFIAGPRDKLFTVDHGAAAGPRPAHGGRPGQARRRAGLRRQDHRRLGRGARPRHRRDARQQRLPGAHHRLDRLDERHLGELLMHFMLETIIAARLIGVDPFDQPAVEEGKVLAKRYLKDSSRG